MTTIGHHGILLGAGTPPSGTWIPYAVQSVNADSGIPGNSTIRQVIPSAGVLACSKVRITILAASASSMTIGELAVGFQAGAGDFYDYASAPTAGLFSGSAGTVISAGGSVVSDAITFPIGSPAALVVGIYMSSGLTFYGNASDGAFLSGSNDVSTIDASGYTTFSSNGFAVSQIEFLVP